MKRAPEDAERAVLPDLGRHGREGVVEQGRGDHQHDEREADAEQADGREERPPPQHAPGECEVILEHESVQSVSRPGARGMSPGQSHVPIPKPQSQVPTRTAAPPPARWLLAIAARASTRRPVVSAKMQTSDIRDADRVDGRAARRRRRRGSGTATTMATPTSVAIAVSSATSPTSCRRMFATVAPFARRRPISRVRCVTCSQSTPVSPMADHDAAGTPRRCRRPRAARARTCEAVSRDCGSGSAWNVQSGAAARSRATARSSNAAVVPGLTRMTISRIGSDLVAGIVEPARLKRKFSGAAILAVLAEVADDADDAHARRGSVARALLRHELADRILVREHLPRQALVDHHRPPRRAIVFLA